jgi:hypothetical protein
MQGIALEGYEAEELGVLPPVYFDKVKRQLTWDRDLIVFHCYSYEDVLKIPKTFVASMPAETQAEDVQPEPAPVQRTVAPEPTRDPEAMRRGHLLQIKFGANAWEAIFWGRDDQGTVVAHKTHAHWALMHLDLERFGAGLAIGKEADQLLIEEIERSLLSQV